MPLKLNESYVVCYRFMVISCDVIWAHILCSDNTDAQIHQNCQIHCIRPLNIIYQNFVAIVAIRHVIFEVYILNIGQLTSVTEQKTSRRTLQCKYDIFSILAVYYNCFRLLCYVFSVRSIIRLLRTMPASVIDQDYTLLSDFVTVGRKKYLIFCFRSLVIVVIIQLYLLFYLLDKDPTLNS